MSNKAVSFDHSKLRGLMVEKHGSVRKFASVSNFSETTLNKKLNNHSYFSLPEVYSISEILGISSENIGLYFFTKKVQ